MNTESTIPFTEEYLKRTRKAGNSIASADGVIGSAISLSLPQAGPQDLSDRFMSALQAGSNAGDKISRLDWRAAFIVADDDLLANVLPSDPPGVGENAWTDLLRAGHAFGIATNIKGLELPACRSHYHALFGGRVQHVLTLSLLGGLRNKQRKRLPVRLHKKNPSLAREWCIACLGSMGVARVAYGLISQGITCILPTPENDVFYGVDLLAERKNNPGHYICMQIKSVRKLGPSKVTLIHDLSVLEPQEIEIAEKTRRRIALFSERHRLDCIPAVVSLGRDNHPTYSLGLAEDILAQLKTLIIQ